eukprot:g5998.t1
MDSVLTSLLKLCSQAHVRNSVTAKKCVRNIITCEALSGVSSRLVCRHIFRGSFHQRSKASNAKKTKNWRLISTQLELLETVLAHNGLSGTSSLYMNASAFCLDKLEHPRVLVRTKAEDVLSTVTVLHALDKARQVNSADGPAVITKVIEEAFNGSYSKLRYSMLQRLRLSCSKKLEEAHREAEEERKRIHDALECLSPSGRARRAKAKAAEAEKNAALQKVNDEKKVKKSKKKEKSKRTKRIAKDRITQKEKQKNVFDIDFERSSTHVSYAEPLCKENSTLARGIIFAFGEPVARCLFSQDWSLRRDGIVQIGSIFQKLQFVDPETEKATLFALRISLCDSVLGVYRIALQLLRLIVNGTNKSIEKINPPVKIPQRRIERIIRALENEVRENNEEKTSNKTSCLQHIVQHLGHTKKCIREESFTTLFSIAQSSTFGFHAVANACYYNAGILQYDGQGVFQVTKAIPKLGKGNVALHLNRMRLLEQLFLKGSNADSSKPALQLINLLHVADQCLNVAQAKLRKQADHLFETIARASPIECGKVVNLLSPVGQERLVEIIAVIDGEASARENIRQLQEQADTMRKMMNESKDSRRNTMNIAHERNSPKRITQINKRLNTNGDRPRTAMRTATAAGRNRLAILPYAAPLEMDQEDMKRVAHPIQKVFGISVTRCIFAKHWGPRGAALRLVEARVRRMAVEKDAKDGDIDGAGLSEIDAHSDLAGIEPLKGGDLDEVVQLFALIERSSQDRVTMVYNDGLALLSTVVELYLPTILECHPINFRDNVHPAIFSLVQSILDRACSIKKRVYDASESAIMLLCSENVIGPSFILPIVLYHIFHNGKEKLEWKEFLQSPSMFVEEKVRDGRANVILSLLKIITKIVQRYGLDQVTIGVEINDLSEIANAGMIHRSKDVRLVSKKFLNLIHPTNEDDGIEFMSFNENDVQVVSFDDCNNAQVMSFSNSNSAQVMSFDDEVKSMSTNQSTTKKSIDRKVDNSQKKFVLLPYSEPLDSLIKDRASKYITVFGGVLVRGAFSRNWGVRMAAFQVAAQRVSASATEHLAKKKSSAEKKMIAPCKPFSPKTGGKLTGKEREASAILPFENRKQAYQTLTVAVSLIERALSDPVMKVQEAGMYFFDAIVSDWIPVIHDKDRRAYNLLTPVLDLIVDRCSSKRVQEMVFHFCQDSSHCRALLATSVQQSVDILLNKTQASEVRLVGALETLTMLVENFGLGPIPTGANLQADALLSVVVTTIEKKWLSVRLAARTLYVTVYIAAGKEHCDFVSSYVAHLRMPLRNELAALIRTRVEQLSVQSNESAVEPSPYAHILEHESHTHDKTGTLRIGHREKEIIGLCFGTDELGPICLCNSNVSMHQCIEALHRAACTIRDRKGGPISNQHHFPGQVESDASLSIEVVWSTSCKVICHYLRSRHPSVIIACMKVFTTFLLPDAGLILHKSEERFSHFFHVPWSDVAGRLSLGAIVKHLTELLSNSHVRVRESAAAAIKSLANAHLSGLDIAIRQLFQSDADQRIESGIRSGTESLELRRQKLCKAHTIVYRLRVLRELILDHDIFNTKTFSLAAILDFAIPCLESISPLCVSTARSVVKTTFSKVDAAVIYQHFAKMPGHMQGIIYPLLPPPPGDQCFDKEDKKRESFDGPVRYRDEDGNLCSLAGRKREGSVDRLRRSLGRADKIDKLLKNEVIHPCDDAGEDSDDLYDFESI